MQFCDDKKSRKKQTKTDRLRKEEEEKQENATKNSFFVIVIIRNFPRKLRVYSKKICRFCVSFFAIENEQQIFLLNQILKSKKSVI